jgi:hypothetical protein
MGLFGPSLSEQLKSIVQETNGYIQSVQSIVGATGDISRLSAYEINRLRTLGQQILLGMNNVSSVIEKKQSLMLSMVPGFYGQVTCMAWMSWAMQWFSSFENQFKPYL